MSRNICPLRKAGKSKILRVLGPDMIAGFTAVRTLGQVVWCDFELARAMGFDVPQSNRMTVKLHDQLIEAFSYRALRPKEDAAVSPTITLHADRYGGDGVGSTLGSGRGGFHAFGNLFLKGIGHTPLFRDDPDDFAHAHGGLHMWQAILEAVMGAACANLFHREPARILAIIDQGDYTAWPDGQMMVRAIAIRSGNQLRPGHLLARRTKADRSRHDIFVDIARSTGQLMKRKLSRSRRAAPDLRATMLSIIDDHARTAAEQIRWRITHGAITASNMQMDGGLMDFTSQRATRRSTPIRPTDEVDPEEVADADYAHRIAEMGRAFRAVVRSIPPRRRRRFNAAWIDVRREMDRAYRGHLETQLLCAVGLKQSVVERIGLDDPTFGRRFTGLLIAMTELVNVAGVKHHRLCYDGAAVVDVFGLLGRMPVIHFHELRVASRRRRIRAALRPVYVGNRFHVGRRRAEVNQFVREFGDLYSELMDRCASLAREYYGGIAAMQTSIMARAAFENRPLHRLFREDPFTRLDYDAAAEAFRSTGDVDVIRRIVDGDIAASLRNVDALLRQGKRQSMANGSVELQIRTIHGVRYAVRAWHERPRRRWLHVRLLLSRCGDGYCTDLPGRPYLSERQASALRYHYSTNGWKTSASIRGQLGTDEVGRPAIDFDRVRPGRLVGELDGFFHGGRGCGTALKDRRETFRGYVFAIPDRHELANLSSVPADRACR